MSIFAKSLEMQWNDRDLQQAQFPIVSIEEMEDGKGQLTSHKPGFEILQVLYLDNGAFVFNTREDLIEEANIINLQFRTFGMEMHIGTNGKKSKAECIFFPFPGYFKQVLLEDTLNPDLTT